MKRIFGECLLYSFILWIAFWGNGCTGQDSRLIAEIGNPKETVTSQQRPDTLHLSKNKKGDESAESSYFAKDPKLFSDSRETKEVHSFFEKKSSEAKPVAGRREKPLKDSFFAGSSISRDSSRISEKSNAEDIENNKQEVVFNFEEADLREVIRTIAEILSLDYILDSDAKGAVTIHTTGVLDKKDIFDIFLQILQINGLTAVKEGGLYKITNIKNSSRMPVLAHFGRDAIGVDSDQRVMIQVIPLEYISAQEMTKILEPFISANGTIISHADSNTLIVVDRAMSINKVLKLIDVFDVDIFEKVSYHFYSVKNIPVEEMANLLKEILSVYGKDEKSGIKLIEIERLNQLLVLSQDQRLFKEIERFLLQLDVAGEGTEPRIYVYSVRNGEAEELGQLLNSVFFGKEKQPIEMTSAQAAQPKESSPFTPPNPFKEKANISEKTEASLEKPAEDSIAPSENRGSSTLRNEVSITPDSIRNALIIEATPSDFLIIRDILERIDVLPRQVLIRVIIAEISLSGREELGVEWSYQKGSGNLSTSLLSAQMGSSGLQFAVGQADRWSAALSALAQDNKINVLSTPTVLASDNKEAKINVSTKVPVASAEYIFDSGVSGVTQTNIQYRDTGIILSVTPHINERGLVSMELNQEVSEQGGGVDVGGQNYPSFRERSVNTTLTVKNGQTIVMGGLMQEREEKGNSGVPFFSKLPLIGFLFGNDTKEFSKNELILLITPQVINNLDEVDAVTEEFKEKIKQVRMNLG